MPGFIAPRVSSDNATTGRAPRSSGSASGGIVARSTTERGRRVMPGDSEDEVRRHLDTALGDLTDDVAVEKLFSKPASVSPTGTPLWDVLWRVIDAHYPGARLLPRLIVGFTDAPYFREHGAIAYRFGLFSRALTAEAMAGRFPGNDERVEFGRAAG